MTDELATGATPGPGARRGQAAWPISWPRVLFEGEGGQSGASGGGTPAGGSGSGGSATPPAGGSGSGDDDIDPSVGDKGREAIRREREARRASDEAAANERKAREAVEAELATLREAGASEAERTLAQARREATSEERARWQTRARATEVRGALRAAGIANDKLLGLALGAPEFAGLKVGEDGEVEGLTEAVTKFKADYPEAFVKVKADDDAGGGGPYGGSEGGRGGGSGTAATMEDAIGERLAAQGRGRRSGS